MRQIGQNAREGGPVRPQPVPLRRPAPGGPAGIVRRPRPLAALVWLCRLLFVLPIGRRAREDRLAGLSHRALRDLGILRADAHAAAWGRVPLRQILPRYPGDGRGVARAAHVHPLSLVRIGKAA